MPRVCSALFSARSWWFPHGGHGSGDSPDHGSERRGGAKLGRCGVLAACPIRLRVLLAVSVNLASSSSARGGVGGLGGTPVASPRAEPGWGGDVASPDKPLRFLSLQIYSRGGGRGVPCFRRGDL